MELTAGCGGCARAVKHHVITGCETSEQRTKNLARVALDAVSINSATRVTFGDRQSESGMSLAAEPDAHNKQPVTHRAAAFKNAAKFSGM